MDQEKIGKYIKNLRLEKGLSQSELADKLGVTFQAVSKWENGKNLPDMQTLNDISKIFGVNIDNIINLNSNKRNKKNFLIPLVIILLSILCLTLIYFYLKKDNVDKHYHVSEITSKNTHFKVYGNITQYDTLSTLVINNISYDGEKDNRIYKEIKCILYKKQNEDKIKLKDCDSKYNSTINEYVKSFKLRLDSKHHVCPDYENMNLTIEFVVTDNSDNNTIYEIPLNIKELNE